uniref:Uncharacterized protein n=2 Tax=environmental samples TaxID=371948 RepID=B3T2S2_9ARCH|nr:hypothetical protein ALOHA_HF4000ANIW93E5ctg7g26 [uncultured marine crenarchaeote HF4000_ANIW93E5]ABZ07296.1 hypothetical protein ALOHA_HF4000ANIW133I6ctg1g14 [uncultured marine crenarchaeote HF4000_ANIW133I6]
MILYVIKIIIQTLPSLPKILETRNRWFYRISSWSIEFCWYRAFFSMNFKNLISDLINLTSILTKSFLT